MRFRGLDLNLLMALDALLSTRSVTAAASRVNLSQPAMSAALRRLRDFYHDDLLIADGKRFHRSALAESLMPTIQACLAEVERLATVSGGFDPMTSQRGFRIIASDYTTMVLLAPFARRMATEAPGVSLDIVPPHDGAKALFTDGGVDLILGPESYMETDHPTETLYLESHVVVGCAGNPMLDAPLSEPAFLAADHVIAAFGPDRRPSFGDQQLDALGIRRRAVITASSFATLPSFLAGTRRLALLQARLAQMLCDQAPLRMVQAPVGLPPMRVMLQYHRTKGSDPGLAWLCAAIRPADTLERT